MQRIVYLCPGQGSQYKGMLKDYLPEIEKIKDTVKEITNIDILSVINSEDESIINDPVNTQILIFLHTYIVWQKIPSSCKEKTVAIVGHSLGEFSSLVCSQTITLEEGLNLVYNRALFMKECVEKYPGMMLAIIGKPYKEFQHIIKELSKEGIIQAANFNSPQQVIITGEKVLIEKSIPLIKETGAKRVIPLKVSGAFHSPLMQEAADKLSAIIDSIEFTKPLYPVLSCATGSILDTADEIKENLKKQMISPVFWDKGIETIHSIFSPDTYWEIGPGKVLIGLVKKILKDVTLLNTDKKSDISEVNQC